MNGGEVVLVIVAGSVFAVGVGWASDVWISRREQRARDEGYSQGYGDGYLDRDLRVRPDAGKGGPQVLEGDQ